MREIKLKGSTPDERLDNLEVLLKHLRRRMNKTIVGIIPPSLITSFVKEPNADGLVLTAAVPGGRIKKGLIVIRDMPSNGVELMLSVKDREKTFSRRLATKRAIEIIDLDLQLKLGDVLEFFVYGEAKNIWVSFLWDAEQSDKTIKQFLLDELEEPELETDDERI